MRENILITGGCGQIGGELVPYLQKRYGAQSVVIFDKKKLKKKDQGVFVLGDVTHFLSLKKTILKYKITTVYHLASLLSATGEQSPHNAWQVNIEGLRNVLDLARTYNLKVFWPSSIAAFGVTTPRKLTPQRTVLEPSTMYGVTKVAGELLCQYYFLKYGVDVRSLRYPGIISWRTSPGGGTTDYAVDIFWQALTRGVYTCFLKKNTRLPMMYIDDAIRATVMLMDAPKEKISVRTSYNVSSISFTPQELVSAMKRAGVPCVASYEPDFRQYIAESWPETIDDSFAFKDWKWKAEHDLDSLVHEMVAGVTSLKKGR